MYLSGNKQQLSPNAGEMGFTNPFHVCQQSVEEDSVMVSGCGNTSTYSTSSSQSSTQSSQCSQIDKIGKFPPETSQIATTQAIKSEKVGSSILSENKREEIHPASFLSKPFSGITKCPNSTGFGPSPKPGQLQYQPLPQQKYNNLSPVVYEDTETISESTITITATTLTTTTTANNSNLVSRWGKFYSSRSAQQQQQNQPQQNQPILSPQQQNHQTTHIPSAINVNNYRNETNNCKCNKIKLLMFKL